MNIESIATSPKHQQLMQQAQARFARWPETDSLTLAQFDLWLDGETAGAEQRLHELGSSRGDREMIKEVQADLVALAGAAVAVRLFREAMLP
jgi:hypothetical protein